MSRLDARQKEFCRLELQRQQAVRSGNDLLADDLQNKIAILRQPTAILRDAANKQAAARRSRDLASLYLPQR